MGYFNNGANVMYPNPGLASQVRSVSIVEVRNHTDLGTDLWTYYQDGMSVRGVIALFAAFV